MKIRAHNELVFTVFFEKESASESMREIFTDVYDKMNKAFTNIEPKVVYKSEIQNNYKNIITWNKGGK